MDDDRISRRDSLLKLGGLARRRDGRRRLEGRPRKRAPGPAAVASGLVSCVLAPEQTEGPVLPRRPQGPPQHHRGKAGNAARAPAGGRRRLELQADQGRRGRHLALRRRRRLLGNERAGHRRRAVPPRDPADGCQGHRALPDDLPGLVPGPHGAHPRHGSHRRQRRAHGPALLPGHADRHRVQALARTSAGRAGRRATPPTASTETAASGRRSSSRRADRATSARSRWASSAA